MQDQALLRTIKDKGEGIISEMESERDQRSALTLEEKYNTQKNSTLGTNKREKLFSHEGVR